MLKIGKSGQLTGIPIANGQSLSDTDFPLIGPSIGPNSFGETATGPSTGISTRNLQGDSASAPQSPYSITRALIRDLTLPTIPNLDIPPSPPGSPPPGMEEKITHFLALKKQGVHFNEKLSQSSALKNPSLLKKLMSFAGVDENDQYETTLPRDVWDPTSFPKSAYKDELAKSQQEISKKREEDRVRIQRETVDFVPATASGTSSKSGTPGPANVSNSRGLRLSAAERVMAGLDRDRPRSPQPSGLASRGRNQR